MRSFNYEKSQLEDNEFISIKVIENAKQIAVNSSDVYFSVGSGKPETEWW